MSEDPKEEAKERTKKKSKAKLFIILGAGVVLAAVAGFGVAFFMGDGKKAEAATGEQSAAAASGEQGAPASREHGATSGGAHAGAHGGEVLLPLETYVVNLSDPRGDRFLKISIKAVTRDESLEKQLNESELLKSRVRDRMLSILGAKTYPEISNPIGKEGLRRELSQELNAVLGPGSVSEILFTEFIVQ